MNRRQSHGANETALKQTGPHGDPGLLSRQGDTHHSTGDAGTSGASWNQSAEPQPTSSQRDSQRTTDPCVNRGKGGRGHEGTGGPAGFRTPGSDGAFLSQTERAGGDRARVHVHKARPSVSRQRYMGTQDQKHLHPMLRRSSLSNVTKQPRRKMGRRCRRSPAKETHGS